MNTVAIRKATRADAEAALLIRNAAIHAQCASHYPADTLKAWTDGGVSEQFIAEVEARCHVATVNGVVAGFGVVNLQTRKINALFVHPEHEGRPRPAAFRAGPGQVLRIHRRETA